MREKLSQDMQMRPPMLEDGMSVFKLIKRCPPLDTNSSYCNILQCSHFSDTSVATLSGDNLLGFVSAYSKPRQPAVLFIWQIAVDECARGCGLATKMLMSILARSVCRNINHLEATITKNNQASLSLFQNIAKKLKAEFQSSLWLDKQKHFEGTHESELLVRVGPFNQA